MGRPDKRGRNGDRSALGTGDVGWRNYLRTLKELGYTGPLTIEREIPNDRERRKDISMGAEAADGS